MRRGLGTVIGKASRLALEQQDEAFGERTFLDGGETVGAHIKTLDVAPREPSEEDAALWSDLGEKLLQRNTGP